MSWSPDVYHRYQNEREQPFHDLLRWLRPGSGLEIADLGCGTGQLSAHLLELLPGSRLLGVDSSAAMLERARPLESPRLRFVQADFRDLEGDFDLIFSNAALQWAPNHPGLLRRLWRRLRPGGQLLVQVPANYDHPTHRYSQEIARSEFGKSFPKRSVLSPEGYSRLLYRLGAEEIQVILKVYGHVLAGAEALVEWTRGTRLTALLPQLSGPEQERFLALYQARLQKRFPERPVYYPFKRILFSALKPR